VSSLFAKYLGSRIRVYSLWLCLNWNSGFIQLICLPPSSKNRNCKIRAVQICIFLDHTFFAHLLILGIYW
jgi:hypothetical protein